MYFNAPRLLIQLSAQKLPDGGAINNMSTSVTRHAASDIPAYAAMESALEIKTRSPALELGLRAVVENFVALGATETDFFENGVRDDAAVNYYVAQKMAMVHNGRANDIKNGLSNPLRETWSLDHQPVR